jgi:endonuclease-3 related protein
VSADAGLPEPVLRAVFELLLAAYGPQHWWPGDTPFEVMVGAVLTQNTAWSNVERAIASLKEIGWLDRSAIADAEPTRLAELIRPVGYFNVKARRLQSFCRFLRDRGGEERLGALATGELRRRLLEVHGVGPETADDMLLYAFDRPVFVIDAYTRRVFLRLGLISGAETYEQLRHSFEASLGPDTRLYNEYHALIVRHAKRSCRTKPDCDGCVLRDLCPAANGAFGPRRTGRARRVS